MIQQFAVANQDPDVQAIADIITVGFFFLWRPGEATGEEGDHPFLFQDITFHIGDRKVPAPTSTEHDRDNATLVSYTFTNQKNGVRGEIVAHGRSGHPRLCPIWAKARHTAHLQANGIRPDRPFNTYVKNGKALRVKSSDITSMLRQAVRSLGPHLGGLTEKEISAKSLRPSGAMALFCARVDPCTIQIIGRWQSGTMLRYLHLQAEPIMRGFANMMVTSGNYQYLAAPVLPDQDHPAV
jgi:hypothetical protein